jgi:hypothetical protein
MVDHTAMNQAQSEAALGPVSCAIAISSAELARYAVAVAVVDAR